MSIDFFGDELSWTNLDLLIYVYIKFQNTLLVQAAIWIFLPHLLIEKEINLQLVLCFGDFITKSVYFVFIP